MWHQMISTFLSAFQFPSESAARVILAVILGIAVGFIWLALYRPSVKNAWLYLIFAASAFLTWAAIAFVQVPLQKWTGQALQFFWNPQTLTRWVLLTGIPVVLLSGLVQEAAKLVPVVVCRLRNHGSMNPREGLIAGAVAGAGFGVFEAVWVFNTIFASGWSWHSVEASGYLALLGFWERFFTVGFHIGSSAIAGYGLGRKWGWQFYLIASALHGAANYAVILLAGRVLSTTQVEVYIAVVAVVVTGIALWLLWRVTSWVGNVLRQHSGPRV